MASCLAWNADNSVNPPEAFIEERNHQSFHSNRNFRIPGKTRSAHVSADVIPALQTSLDSHRLRLQSEHQANTRRTWVRNIPSVSTVNVYKSGKRELISSEFMIPLVEFVQPPQCLNLKKVSSVVGVSQAGTDELF